MALLQCHHALSPRCSVCVSFPPRDASDLPRSQRAGLSGRAAGSDMGTVIYEGTITRTVRLVKIFSIGTSSMVVCAQPWIFKATMAAQTPTPMVAALALFCGVFVGGTPLMLHWVTRRYITQIRYDRPAGVFTLTTLSLFARAKHLSFTAADVHALHVPAMFSNVEVKKRHLLMDPSAFTDRDAYIQMMRYDEPMDWEMTPPTAPSPQIHDVASQDEVDAQTDKTVTDNAPQVDDGVSRDEVDARINKKA